MERESQKKCLIFFFFWYIMEERGICMTKNFVKIIMIIMALCCLMGCKKDERLTKLENVLNSLTLTDDIKAKIRSMSCHQRMLRQISCRLRTLLI